MRPALLLTLALAAAPAVASEGATGVFGMGDPLEVGLVGGTYAATTTEGGGGSTSAILLGARVHAGAYTHRTFLGMAGGVEATGTFGRALGDSGFWWGQLDGLANLGVLNLAADRFVARLHLLAGFGISLTSGGCFQGGARVALGLKEWVSLEASYLVLPTVNLTLAHRASAALAIPVAQLALGAQLDFGSVAPGATHLSLLGTVSWRPHFD